MDTGEPAAYDDDFMRQDPDTLAIFSSLFMHAPAVVALMRGPDHIIDTVNPVYERFFGDTSSVGQPLFAALPQLRRQHDFCELLDRVYRTGEAVTGRQWTMRPRGTTEDRILSFSYQPMYGKDRKIEGVAVFAFDVTEQVRAAQQLRELTQTLEKAHEDLRGQDDYFAVIAHELRTPITSVLGWSRLLKSPDADWSLREEGLESIAASATVLANLIEDLLDDVRASTGKLRLEMQSLDLSAAASAAMSAFAPAAEAKGIRVSTQFPMPCVIEGDFNRLQQAIWNVLANAVKFTPSGGEIEIVSSCTETDAVLTIRDSGIGIDASVLAHIFEKFRQVEPTTVERRAGLGLGLWIARRLIELHGGELTAASEGENRGTTFTIRIPH